LEDLGYKDWIKFQRQLIRGFDYYDGMVFEVFDNHPENNRSLFGVADITDLHSYLEIIIFPQ
jgi:histidyl-tRNA synthetase